MSLYEVLVFLALAAVGAYAWHLYRSDSRRPSPGPDAGAAGDAAGQLMFKRVPKNQAGDGAKPAPRD